MSATTKIHEAIKQSLIDGSRVKIDLREASTLTGSGNGIGGRTYFDDAFAALRYANPFRQGARQIKAPGSSAVQFVAKTGNATNQTNPWGYTFTPDSGTPNTSTSIWQLPTRVVTAQLPIRTAALDDINYITETLTQDLALEFSAVEAASMALNNDQAGSTTTTTGGTDGLRGLNYYAGGSTSAFGSSGTAMTDGIHTIATVSVSHTALDREDIDAVANALPPQYWGLPGTAWMMHPTAIKALRDYVHGGTNQSSYGFVETGDADGGALTHVFGWPVIPNSYLQPYGTAGNFPIYLANWPAFMTIADVEEMTIQMMEQSAPGFVTMYAEKRMVSTVRDPFAGVRVLLT